MRNLKKILALVLALIMSLSLMATANAKTDFKDDESIDTYQTAIEVLSGLKVFGGDQNGNFNPKDPIRRSEVAAIIYRIATGDVTNDHSASYGLYNQFKDVQDGDWFAGYVSYCHNAGYIKGHGDSTFAPYDNVTGYQALAMILRAVGYDKNNEFTGDNWQINTASIATQRGVLSGLKSTEDLKAPASRELVAEILFQSILLDKVQWNALTHSYDTTNEKVCDVLSLEEISGTVMANEWANINVDAKDSSVGTRPIATGKTEMATDKGVKTLDWTTNLTDLGETRNAYIQKGKVLYMEDGGDTLYENNGEPKDIANASKFKSVTGVSYNNDTQWFVNFGPNTEVTSDYRIEFSVSIKDNMVGTANDPYTYFGMSKEKLETIFSRADGEIAAGTGDFAGYTVYTKAVKPNTVFTPDEVDVMHNIFRAADHDPYKNAAGNLVEPTKGVAGYVFKGTNSSSSVDRNRDLSDDLSWTAFRDEYLNYGNKREIRAADAGEWLKVIDNDADGVADYVFLTESHLDQVTRVINKKDDTTVYQFYNVDNDNYGVRYLKDGEMVDSLDLAQNTKVLWSLIDNNYYMELAAVETGSVKKVNYGTAGLDSNYYLDSVDTVEEVNYKQSGIDNETRLEKWLRNASRDVEYYFYADHFGTIRAYEPVNGTQYALLTEAYSRNTDNGKYLRNWIGTVEHKIGDAAIANATVDNFNGNYERGQNPFFDRGWSERITQANGVWLLNFLTRATGNLDAATTRPVTINENAFNWGTDNRDNAIWSQTNVAAYTKSSDGTITINSVAQQATDDAGNYLYRNVVNDKTVINTTPNQNGILWDSNYVKLDATKDIKKAMYSMDSGLYGANEYLHATPDTEYYIVNSNNETIRYYVGYSAFPGFDAKYVQAAYAVAHNDYGTSGSDYKDYWIADVVVIELNNTYTTAYDDVVLVTYNQDKWRASDSMYTLYGISAKTGEEVTFQINRNEWTNEMTNSLPFFVGTRNVSSDGDVEVRTISRRFTAAALDENGRYTKTLDFSENGINAGRINIIPGAKDGGIASYVNVLNYKDEQVQLNLPNVYTVSNNSRNNIKDYDITRDYVYNSNLKTYGNEGDLILWVNKPGTTTPSFVVMVTTRDENTGAYSWTWIGKACEKSELSGVGADNKPNGTGYPIAPTNRDSLSILWKDVTVDAGNDRVVPADTVAPIITVTAKDGTVLWNGSMYENAATNSTVTLRWNLWSKYAGEKVTVTVAPANSNNTVAVFGQTKNTFEVELGETTFVNTGITVQATSKGVGDATTAGLKSYKITIKGAEHKTDDVDKSKLVVTDAAGAIKDAENNAVFSVTDAVNGDITFNPVQNGSEYSIRDFVNSFKTSNSDDEIVWTLTNQTGSTKYVVKASSWKAVGNAVEWADMAIVETTAANATVDNTTMAGLVKISATIVTVNGANSLNQNTAAKKDDYHISDSAVTTGSDKITVKGDNVQVNVSNNGADKKADVTIETGNVTASNGVSYKLKPVNTETSTNEIEKNDDGTYTVKDVAVESDGVEIKLENAIELETDPIPAAELNKTVDTENVKTENGDKVEVRNPQIVLGEDGVEKRVLVEIVGEEKPNLKPSDIANGVKLYEVVNGELVAVARAFTMKWVISLPNTGSTTYVTVSADKTKVTVSIELLDGETSKRLTDAVNVATGALDAIAQAYDISKTDNAYTESLKVITDAAETNDPKNVEDLLLTSPADGIVTWEGAYEGYTLNLKENCNSFPELKAAIAAVAAKVVTARKAAVTAMNAWAAALIDTARDDTAGHNFHNMSVLDAAGKPSNNDASWTFGGWIADICIRLGYQTTDWSTGKPVVSTDGEPSTATTTLAYDTPAQVEAATVNNQKLIIQSVINTGSYLLSEMDGATAAMVKTEFTDKADAKLAKAAQTYDGMKGALTNILDLYTAAKRAVGENEEAVDTARGAAADAAVAIYNLLDSESAAVSKPKWDAEGNMTWESGNWSGMPVFNDKGWVYAVWVADMRIRIGDSTPYGTTKGELTNAGMLKFDSAEELEAYVLKDQAELVRKMGLDGVEVLNLKAGDEPAEAKVTAINTFKSAAENAFATVGSYADGVLTVRAGKTYDDVKTAITTILSAYKTAETAVTGS